MSHKTKAVWRGDMSFDIELQGFSIRVDADESVGGKNQGPTPKPLMLASLAGCTGMDVVAILGKMQMPYDRFELDISGETTEEHPKVYREIHIDYKFWGSELDEPKIQKAVKLSQEKYCGVSATLSEVGEVRYTIHLNP
ncbi:MAG: OsmC family protein [Alkalispirochaetaceae bacterium]